jgi:hypothetical protein
MMKIIKDKRRIQSPFFEQTIWSDKRSSKALSKFNGNLSVSRHKERFKGVMYI